VSASALRVQFVLVGGRFATATYENATPDMIVAELRQNQQIRTDQGMVQTKDIVNFTLLAS
jgi:hypothetical protein